MTTEARAPAPTKKLYKGEENGGHIGEVLAKMVSRGREVSDTQRNRWQQNRRAYQGDRGIGTHRGARQLASTSYRARASRTLDTINRLRPFTDARVSLMTAQRPSFEVRPSRMDQDHIDAARLATKFLEGTWTKWRVPERMRELSLWAEQDGVSFLNVIYDRNDGLETRLPVGPDGEFITDPGVEENLRMAGMLEYRPVKMGEVAFRVVRAGRLAVDPFMTTDWNEARWVVESRLMPTSEVEDIAGKKLPELAQESAMSMGIKAPATIGDSQISVGNDEGGRNLVAERDAALVHEAFIRPGGDWPEGAHVMWADVAPNKPLVSHPWRDELPYRPYIPRPSGGHILRSKGIVDDLRPIQDRFDRILSLVHDHLDLVGRPPIGVPVGSLRSKSIFNDERTYFYHGHAGPPTFMNVPPEPSGILTTHLQWMEQQMAEVSMVSNPSRGMSPGQGVESAIGINTLIQQTEQQMSGTEARFVECLEWGVQRALKLVARHYKAPRMVSMPGVDDSEELESFKGEMLRDATEFRINGTLLPKSKAAQIQSIMQLIPVLGEQVKPYLHKFVDGDLSEWTADQEKQAKKQRRENRAMAILLREPKVEQIWQDFQAMQQQYADALQMAAQPVGGEGDPGDPTATLAAAGIQAPNFTAMLSQAGLPVPQVESHHAHGAHLQQLDNWRVSDGFDKAAPQIKQLAREHEEAHKAAMSSQLMAMAGQEPTAGNQGSPQAAPKGEASAPKPSGTESSNPSVAPPSK